LKQYQFTIITVTFNNYFGLKKTINSISNQTYNNFEHIVIDGNSNDGTKAFLESLQIKILTVISEPDKGIYDAMNKGLKLAKGDWVIFMNAGDIFCSDTVLLDFANQKFSSDIVYGNCIVKYDNGFERVLTPKSLNELWKGMSFSHQTVFIKSNLLKEHLFDLSYKYCADFNQIFNFYLNDFSFKYWNDCIAIIEAGGVSDSKRYLATNEVYKINKKLNPKLKNHFYFLPKISWSFVVVKIKSILPNKWIKKLTSIKYK